MFGENVVMRNYVSLYTGYFIHTFFLAKHSMLKIFEWFSINKINTILKYKLFD